MKSVFIIQSKDFICGRRDHLQLLVNIMNIKKSKWFTLGAASVFCVSAVLQSASAEQLVDEKDLLSLPELVDSIESQNSAVRAGNIRMKCYVDTPAYDHFTYGSCFTGGYAPVTLAVFFIDNVPAGSQVIWSNGSCTANSNYCMLPIRTYGTVSLNATVLKPNGTYSQTSATAYYEGLN